MQLSRVYRKTTKIIKEAWSATSQDDTIVIYLPRTEYDTLVEEIKQWHLPAQSKLIQCEHVKFIGEIIRPATTKREEHTWKILADF